MQDDKSLYVTLRAAVIICDTLVKEQADIYTSSFLPAVLLPQPAELIRLV